jgi:hypothetical protein
MRVHRRAQYLTTLILPNTLHVLSAAMVVDHAELMIDYLTQPAPLEHLQEEISSTAYHQHHHRELFELLSALTTQVQGQLPTLTPTTGTATPVAGQNDLVQADGKCKFSESVLDKF